MDFKKILSKYAWLIIVLILGAVFGLDVFAPREDVIFDRSGTTITDELLAYWNKGTFDDVRDSLEYHFAKHGAEVDADTIAEYARKAADYRDEVLRDISSLSEDGLAAKYNVTVSNGKVPAHKYKHREDSRFIIISDDGYLILSFGR